MSAIFQGNENTFLTFGNGLQYGEYVVKTQVIKIGEHFIEN